jgi:hypothetical protein
MSERKEKPKAERRKVKGVKESEVGSQKSEEPPTAERLAPTELPTANSQLQTEQMEVHHHPDLHHEKKPWKEYLLEGLMIFLAVTMGFFAESLREHISNKDKGHEFVVSLLADLKKDTADINGYAVSHVKRLANYKLLLGWLDQPIREDTAYRAQFYKAAGSTLGMESVNFTNRIISQLKNSDNFRLINNHKVADAIADYSNGTAVCDKQREVVEHFTEECSKPAMEMINLKAYRDHFLGSGVRKGDSAVPFRSTDLKILQDYSNAIYLKIGVERNYARMIKEQQQRAIKLIALLKKEYDLEDE